MQITVSWTELHIDFAGEYFSEHFQQTVVAATRWLVTPFASGGEAMTYQTRPICCLTHPAISLLKAHALHALLELLLLPSSALELA